MQIREILTGVAVVMLGVAVLTAVAVTPAFAAATAPPGYRIVSTPDLAAPASIFNTTGQANCPTGTVPWGGGASLTNGFAVPGTSINTFIEPQYSVVQSGLGVPLFQIFAGVVIQLPFKPHRKRD